MKETASKAAKRLMGEIESASKSSYTKGDVKAILNMIAQMEDVEVVAADDTCRGTTSVACLRRGDVFIHKLVGGKVRPWVVLGVDGEVVRAVAVSSGDSAPNLIKSQCRLWPGAWLGSTITQVRISDAVQEVTRPYTNLNHLREIEETLAARLGMAMAPRNMTIQDISARLLGAA